MTFKINEKDIPPAAIGTWAWGGGFNGSRMIFGTSPDSNILKETFQMKYAILSLGRWYYGI